MNKTGMNEQQKTTSYYSRLYLFFGIWFSFGFGFGFGGYDYLCRLILVGNYKKKSMFDKILIANRAKSRAA